MKINSKQISILSFSAALCLILIAPLCIIYFSSPTANTHVIWDWANALGYISISIALLLFIYSGKPSPYPNYSGKFFVNFHRDLGFIALILIVLHITILLITEPLLIEHIKLTAPIYMLSGLLAAILILVIAFSSIRPFRKKLWGNYLQFKRFHNILSILAVSLIAIHIYISRFYANHTAKLLLLLALCIISLTLYMKRKWINKTTKFSKQRINLDNKTETRISYVCLFLAAVFALLLVFTKHYFIL